MGFESFDSYWKCLISCYIPLFVTISWMSSSKRTYFFFSTHILVQQIRLAKFTVLMPRLLGIIIHILLPSAASQNLFLFPTERTGWHAQPQFLIKGKPYHLSWKTLRSPIFVDYQVFFFIGTRKNVSIPSMNLRDGRRLAIPDGYWVDQYQTRASSYFHRQWYSPT